MTADKWLSEMRVGGGTKREGKNTLQGILKKILGVMDMFTISILVMFSRISTLIKLYILIVYGLLHKIIPQ